VASERIKVLSSGRYQLTLQAEEGRERALAGGLDLYVTDSHTGRTRAVQTLSGGEQFLTSLALALALADVVQQMSGGMELSSLFIDEGFGSLDGETLDTAVEVLRTLQDSGRSVGVISHVEAMQHDLPVGIRVIPGPTGSRITFPALSHG
jgi:exonuclease SbcC